MIIYTQPSPTHTIVVLQWSLREGVKKQSNRKQEIMRTREAAYLEQEEASWLAGLLKSIRELGLRPLIPRFPLLCQLSGLTGLRHHPD